MSVIVLFLFYQNEGIVITSICLSVRITGKLFIAFRVIFPHKLESTNGSIFFRDNLDPDEGSRMLRGGGGGVGLTLSVSVVLEYKF